MSLLSRFAALVLTTLAVVGCDSGDEERYYDRYAYTAFDADGAVVAEGTLDLAFVFNDAPPYGTVIQGSKDVEAAEGVGPHGGEGAIGGRVAEDATVLINLNPGVIDNDVALVGACATERCERVTGTWTWNGIAVLASGPFEMDLTQRATVTRTFP